MPALYEAVRDLCVLGEVGAPHMFVSSYLAHVQPQEDVLAAPVQEEALETLLTILSTSHAAYDTWINLYPTHFVHSNVVLDEMRQRFSSMGVCEEARRCMQVALNSFISKNASLTGTSCKLPSGVRGPSPAYCFVCVVTRVLVLPACSSSPEERQRMRN